MFIISACQIPERKNLVLTLGFVSKNGNFEEKKIGFPDGTV